MKEIRVRYQGADHIFEVYATTLSGINNFFVKAKDKALKTRLSEDHFFIMAGQHRAAQYVFNAIAPTQAEEDFKTAITQAVLDEFFAVGYTINKTHKN